MSTPSYFFTGFPGFIANQIIIRLLTINAASEFQLLVHPSQLEKAKQHIDRIVTTGKVSGQQFHVISGDITQENLGLSKEETTRLHDRVEYVFHLAAIYDLAVPRDFAELVNVTGTANVTHWVEQLTRLKRYVYFSTAYVSGTRAGRILETELDVGQGFKNHYESTKFEAEKIVQSVRERIPTTIIRPGIVMGDSRTGDTVKFDGPYFMMRFLDKFARFPIPYLGRGEARINLVPVDYVVDATCYLSHHPIGENQVYHLTDPHPYLAKDAYRLICERLLGKRPSFTLPTALVYAALSSAKFRQWVGVERETVAYFNLLAEYDSSQAQRDLAESGIRCPDFKDYITVATAFYKTHRLDPSMMIRVQ